MSERILIAACVIDYNQRSSDGGAFVPSLIKLVQEWDGPPNSLKYYEVWRQVLHMAQEQCVRYALQHNFTHILFIEDDTTKLPDNIIRRLLNHKKDVVGCFAYARHFPHFPTIFRKAEKDKNIAWTHFLGPQTVLVTPFTGLRKVDMMPFQLTLIRTSVFERIAEPWFEFFRKINGYGATDQFFAERCVDAGIELWCDTDMVLQHAGIDEYTAGFNAWRENNKEILGKWMPAGSVPFLRMNGIDAIAEENPDVYSEMLQVSKHNGRRKRPRKVHVA